MITVKIGGMEREFDGNPRWIQEQIDGRQKDGQTVCVSVTIRCSGIEFSLVTPGCAGGRGMTRSLSAGEQELLELWRHHKLDTTAFNSGNLVAFLQRIKSRC
jgi:hypothetical protein